MEHLLDLQAFVGGSSRVPGQTANGASGEGASTARREERAARGAAVHSLLEWSQAHGWREPSAEVVAAHAAAAGLEHEDRAGDDLLAPLRAGLGSDLLANRIAGGAPVVRAEVPFLLRIGTYDDGASGNGGRRFSILRGSIDLLVEREGEPPLVVDYKTDRLNGGAPGDRAAHYGVQRDVYALAVAEARRVSEVEVAYVFLERADEPVLQRLDAAAIEAGRERLAATIEPIGQGKFPPAAPERRDWALCEGCPALGELCSGPAA
jgi:ATP-dependent exoDNAse (exonuclease V) beta subunit